MNKRNYKYNYFYRNLISETFRVMHQIWLKGVPLEIGDLQLFTKKRQVFIKKNYKKKRKGKHYSIIFDPLDIPISMTKGNRKFMFSNFSGI